jgi:hypothetical protein
VNRDEELTPMDMRVRRASLPAALAVVFLLLLGWHAVPARAASVDPELVAESVTEDGYYVDSSASYLQSDADLDRLRQALQQAGRAGVVVLPAGTATGPVVDRLLQSPNHKATYVVLTGTKLQAASNSLSRSTVNKLVAKATRAGNPKSQVLSFLSLMNPRHSAKSGAAPQKGGNLPMSPTSQAPSTDPTTTPVAATKSDSGGGGNGMLYGIGGLVVVVAAVAGGFLLWRRRQGTADTDGPAAG